MECTVDIKEVKDLITSDKFTQFILTNTTDFGAAAFILQTLLDAVDELEEKE